MEFYYYSIFAGIVALIVAVVAAVSVMREQEVPRR